MRRTITPQYAEAGQNVFKAGMRELLLAAMLSAPVLFAPFAARADENAAPIGDTPVRESAADPETGEPSTVTYRQRPGEEPRPSSYYPFIYESIPDINSSASDFVPVPDRWRQFYAGKWYDPYNQNEWKGDLPMFGEPGHEWFVELSLISDTLLERRKIPVGVGFESTENSQSTDQFGDGNTSIFQQNFIPSIAIIRGNTTFKPPELEFRIVPVVNVNHARFEEEKIVRIDSVRDTTRDDAHIGFNELFVDYHLANLSERYDFISTRVGIQHFASDFRGFVFTDDAPGVRLFGNYDNNKTQYNLAYFSRLDKDTNSGINTTFQERHEDVIVGNLFRQDALALGHQLQGVIIQRNDTAGNHGFHYDQNGFLVRPSSFGDERPKNIYSTYFGLNGDGHFGRINTTSAFYYVTGSESHSPIAERAVDINAGMAALEVSYDQNWIRYRVSAFYASGDSDPFDNKAEGFDAVLDNPNFAGGDLSYWQRQGIPLVGGGGVNLTNRLSLLPNLRAGKEEGQSNFVNPGLRLLNLGVDFEVLPELKIITNASYLQFDEVAVLETIRHDGSISRDIGYDLSVGGLYRPFLNNNVQVRFGTAVLIPDDGVENLFGDEVLYDFFTNLILQY